MPYSWEWTHYPKAENIIAYRLHKPTDNDDKPEQDNKEMTTLHDWVHELESIKTRSVELRELIAKEVQKCGGNVEWGGCTVREQQAGKTTNFDEVTFDHFIVISGSDTTYLTDGKKYKVISLDKEDGEIGFKDDDGCYEFLNTALPNYDWYAVTGDK